MLLSKGLLVFCGTGGLVGSRLKVGLLLAVVAAVGSLFGVVAIISVPLTSSSLSILFIGEGVVVALFLGRNKGLFLIPTFPAPTGGLLLANKSANLDFGLNLLLDRPLPPIVGRTILSSSTGTGNSVVVASSSDSVDNVVSTTCIVVSADGTWSVG